MKIKEQHFTGFSAQTFDYLRNVRFNNSKEWFESNRKDYEEHLIEPFKALVKNLGDFMLSIDPHLEITPGVGKTISRIRRDTRFSKDKSLYRDSMWITFKRKGRDWKLDPCYFFEIMPGLYRFGMGFYSASKEAIGRLREIMDTDPGRFSKVLSLYSNQSLFTLEGEKYKKILDKTKSEEELNWYQRKDMYFMCKRTDVEKLFDGRALVDELKAGFTLMKPFYEFLWDIKNEGENKIIR